MKYKNESIQQNKQISRKNDRMRYEKKNMTGNNYKSQKRQKIQNGSKIGMIDGTFCKMLLLVAALERIW